MACLHSKLHYQTTHIHYEYFILYSSFLIELVLLGRSQVINSLLMTTEALTERA